MSTPLDPQMREIVRLGSLIGTDFEDAETRIITAVTAYADKVANERVKAFIVGPLHSKLESYFQQAEEYVPDLERDYYYAVAIQAAADALTQLSQAIPGEEAQ